MGNIPFRMIALFTGAYVGQLMAIVLLPLTSGFTNPSATMGFITISLFSAWTIARLVHGGVSLGILLPLMSATVPLGAVVVGIVMHGESASFLRVALLVFACGLVGLASRTA
jgi:quaternary ammonium compound-resistance protein SugE